MSISLANDRLVAGVISYIDKARHQHDRRERALGMRDWEAKRRAVRWEVAAFRLKVTLVRWAVSQRKAFNPNQPRVPAGTSTGGQWASDGNPGNHTRVAHLRPPDIGHNQGPPLEDPPKIPKRRPSTTQDKNAFVKVAARWLAKATLRGLSGPIGLFAAGLEAASWLQGDQARIESYSDSPQTLPELQQAVATPRWGYDIHHIVERAAARRAGFSPELIHSPENLVRIPTLKHWELNGWYARPNEIYGNLSPRQYLQGKSWEEHRRVGLDGLRVVGVLKP